MAINAIEVRGSLDPTTLDATTLDATDTSYVRVPATGAGSSGEWKATPTVAGNLRTGLVSTVDMPPGA